MHKYFFFTILLLSSNFIYSLKSDLWCESAILIDFDTEQILYQKNIDMVIPPASMTKLVTIYVTYNYLKDNNIDKNSFINISENADWRNLPRDSSLMFIEQGQKVTFKELLIGLAIPSGNDAAIAIAEAVSGSVEDFVKDMNNEMSKLGFKTLRFVEPSGYRDENQISVREFVQFCKILIEKYPEALEELFSLPYFTYPLKKNGNTSIGGIKQYNRNPMIELYPGCDGLKTGFIYRSGMNISLTAESNNRRILTVITGIKDNDKENAQLKRIVDSTKLLDFGLSQKNIFLDKLELPSITVEGGMQDAVKPVIPYKKIITLNSINNVKYNIDTVKAPIKIGDKLGTVTFEIYDSIYEFPIYSNTYITKKPIINYFFNK